MTKHLLVARRASALLLLLVGVFMASLSFAQQPSQTDLPVTRVVLFTNGVGYFEHEGTVEGDQVLTLDVPRDAMDDLLQSLVLQDLDGGTITPVRYTAQDPLQRVLNGYQIDVSSNLPLYGVLLQARGAEVTLVGGRTVSGHIVGVEQVQQPDQAPRAYVTLATSTGLVRAPLDEFEEVRFADPAIKAQLDAALAAMANHARDDSSQVNIGFSGEGVRRVRVGYLREMPVWKSTYRLVLADEGKATLQGWAILDNPTNVRLENVKVSFVAGQPISFVTSLFEPRYVERPRLETELAGNVVARADTGSMLPALTARAPMFAAPMEAAMGGAFLGDGVESLASTAAAGASFSYDVTQPVTVGPYESAMVPIVVTTVTASQLAVYDEATLEGHPLHAVRLSNDTGLHLAAGTVTLFGPEGFAGTAQLTDLLPGDSRLLQYAVDLETSLLRTSSDSSESVTSVRLRGGVLETTSATRRTTTVNVTTLADEPRFLVVELPRAAGFSVVSPKPAPAMTDTHLRFGVSLQGGTDTEVPTQLVCAAGEPCTLEVVQERIDRRTVALTNVGTDMLGYYLQGPELSAADRATLQRVLDLQREAATARAQLRADEEAIAVIHDEQARIRQNMAALEQDSPLYRRYVADLTAQEDQLAELLTSSTGLRDQVRSLEQSLNDLIAGLGE